MLGVEKFRGFLVGHLDLLPVVAQPVVVALSGPGVRARDDRVGRAVENLHCHDHHATSETVCAAPSRGGDSVIERRQVGLRSGGPSRGAELSG